MAKSWSPSTSRQRRRPADRRPGRGRPAGRGAAGVGHADRRELRQLGDLQQLPRPGRRTDGGGYGRLYGPLVAPRPRPTRDGQDLRQGVLAFARGRDGDQNITLMVQIPDAFDPARACIITGPSSGSRGVYGAIGTAGEWGLKQGCAVAYTDKGTGTGAHDLQRDTVSLLRGERADADAAGDFSTFTAELHRRAAQRLQRAAPDRWAWKHAHSELNPEADWDRACRAVARASRCGR